MYLPNIYEKLEIAARNFKRNLSHIVVGEELFYYALERNLTPDTKLVLDPKFPPSFYKLVMNSELDFSQPTPKELRKTSVNAILLSTKTAREPLKIVTTLSDSHPSKERLAAIFKKFPEYDTLKIEAVYNATY